MRDSYDVVVIGAGPAGLAAATEARKNGAESVLMIERDRYAGGILNQCIHNGFGLHYFKEELTGPEYAGRFIDIAAEAGAELVCDTMVLELIPGAPKADGTSEKHRVCVTGPETGYREITADAIVLCMGCRERTRDAIRIPGTRPAGVFTAGAAQRYVNMEGYMVGHKILILGSGDIGLIMARRLTLEGAEVLACVELLPYSGGLNRNIVQCLNDYGIPLYLSHTVTDISGRDRVKKITVMKVDENRKPIPGTEMYFEADALLLSVGLIPENELSNGTDIESDRRTSGPIVYENMETTVPGIFAGGNVVHVHDLVDFVTAESTMAGKSAGLYVKAVKKARALSEQAAAAPEVESKAQESFEATATETPQKESERGEVQGQKVQAQTAQPQTEVQAKMPQAQEVQTQTAQAQTAQPQKQAQTEEEPTEEQGRYIKINNGDNVGYTVPQRIRPDKLDKSQGIFFRVRQVFADGGTIRVTLGGKEIAKFNRDHMAPGEMENIKIPQFKLRGALKDLEPVEIPGEPKAFAEMCIAVEANVPAGDTAASSEVKPELHKVNA